MKIDKKFIEEYKKIFTEKYGREVTDAEAEDGCERLAMFAKICVDIQVKKIKEVCHRTCPIWHYLHPNVEAQT